MRWDFRSPIDDDSHTLADGALPRFMRMRKWLLFTSFVLIVLDVSQFDFSGIATMLAFPGIHREVVRETATGIGFYLLIQAILVTPQILMFLGPSIGPRVDLLVRHQREPMDQLIRKLEDLEEKSETDTERLKALHIRRKKFMDRTSGQRLYLAVTEIGFDLWRVGMTLLILSYALLIHGDGDFSALGAVLSSRLQ